MTDHLTEVSSADHALGDNTQGYILNYEKKDVFFTVTDPDWSVPKGTIVYFHGPNEFSDLLGDQIENWTDAGYRVVTLDMPGAGRSSRDAEVGSQNLLHMESIDERVEATTRVLEAVDAEYTSTPGGLHFVTNSTGNVVAMNVLNDLPAGSVQSLSAVSPVFDVDIWGSDLRRNPVFTADPDYAADQTSEVVSYTGEHLSALRSEFFRNNGQSITATPWSKAYFNTTAAGVFDIKHHSTEYVNVLKRNGVEVAFIYDSEIDHIFDADNTKSWARSNYVDATLTTMDGDGVDLIYNPERSGDVLKAIESNIQSASPFVALIDKLRTVHRDEWNQMSQEDRQSIQKLLTDKGYSVGPTGIDGVPRYGAVAYTEHAVAQFLVDADKAGKLDLSTLKNSQFTPEGIKSLIEQTDHVHIAKPPVPSVSGSAITHGL